MAPSLTNNVAHNVKYESQEYDRPAVNDVRVTSVSVDFDQKEGFTGNAATDVGFKLIPKLG